MALTIIEAGRGAGKTTFARAYAAWFAAGGQSVGGIVSDAVYHADARVGYDLVDLRTNVRRPLARLAAAAGTTPTIGRFVFDDQAVAEGNAAIIAAVQDGVRLIAVDEVGPLELQGDGWSPALHLALAELKAWQELLLVVRPSLRDQLPARFPSDAWAAASRISPPWPTLHGPSFRPRSTG